MSTQTDVTRQKLLLPQSCERHKTPVERNCGRVAVARDGVFDGVILAAKVVWEVWEWHTQEMCSCL